MKCLFSTAAMVALMFGLLSARADDAPIEGKKIVYFDPVYSTRFVHEPEEVARYYQSRGFETMNTVGLVSWMEQAIKDGSAAGTVVLNFTGVTPRALAEPFDKDALVYRYCAAGGRFVMGGGSVLYLFQGETDVRIYQQWESENIPKRMLTAFGITPAYGLTGKDIGVTEEGRKWGLSDGEWNKRFLNGGAMPAEQVTHTLIGSADGKSATAWQVNVNPEYPHSGLVGFAAFEVGPTFEPFLELLYKLAVYKGQPVTEVPQVQWRTSDAVPTLVVDVSMKPGLVERRSYQRGESIPLNLVISGPQYSGQNATVSLRLGEDVLWTRQYSGATPSLEINETLETADLRSGEYVFDVRLEGVEDSAKRETVWICAPRPNNEYLLAVGKGVDENPLREEITSKWVRDHNLNVNYYYGHRLASQLERFAEYLDQLMRFELIANANLSCIPLLAERDHPLDALVLPDGRKIHEGEKAMMSSRALVNDYADVIRDGHREQAQILHDLRNPILRPILITNDDSTYTGHLDFSELTIKDFEAKTGIAWSEVPKPVQIGTSNHFRGDHAEGIVADDDRWLAYMRYQIGKYRTILDLTMQGVQSGWPGALAAEIPCMSGPMFIERSIWPPIHAQKVNTTSFYLYYWLPQYYTFSAEAARMNNRGKPAVYTISSSYLTWGAVHQRMTTYHTLAENPAGVTLYKLDHPPAVHLQGRETEQYEELAKIGAKMSRVAKLLENAGVPRRKAALFIGFSQSCFDPEDRDRQFAAFDNLLRAGADVELVSEDEVLAGKASEYQTIVLNGIRWMQQSTQQALEKYVAEGGKVICDSATTIPIQGSIRLDAPIATTQMDYASARGIERVAKLLGNGIPAVENIRPGDDGNTLIRPLVKDGQLLAWVLDAETEEQSRELESARSGDRWVDGQYELLTEWNAKTPTVRKAFYVAEGLFAYDLWKNQEISLSPGKKGWRGASMEVEFLGASLVALYRQRIGDWSAAQPRQDAQTGRNTSAAFTLQSVDAKPFKGFVPVEVRVYYPDGKEAWEYGRDALMADGQLNVDLTIARNDPIGDWRIETRELCTGRKAATILTVAGPSD
jgi:hypothetical protein